MYYHGITIVQIYINNLIYFLNLKYLSSLDPYSLVYGPKRTLICSIDWRYDARVQKPYFHIFCETLNTRLFSPYNVDNNVSSITYSLASILPSPLYCLLSNSTIDCYKSHDLSKNFILPTAQSTSYYLSQYTSYSSHT